MIRQWCVKHGATNGWHITKQFMERADPDKVKMDGPFVVLETGEAYEIVGECPLIPTVFDCVILDKKGLNDRVNGAPT